MQLNPHSDDPGEWFSGRFRTVKLLAYGAACIVVPCLLLFWAAWRFG